MVSFRSLLVHVVVLSLILLSVFAELNLERCGDWGQPWGSSKVLGS